MQRAVSWMSASLTVVLIALIFISLVNIFVKATVQHASVIANSLLLVLVTGLFIFVKVHKVEAIGESIRVLGMLLF